jgi:hypothetical protein
VITIAPFWIKIERLPELLVQIHPLIIPDMRVDINVYVLLSRDLTFRTMLLMMPFMMLLRVIALIVCYTCDGLLGMRTVGTKFVIKTVPSEVGIGMGSPSNDDAVARCKPLVPAMCVPISLLVFGLVNLSNLNDV